MFRATIRGEYYGVISQDNMDEECYFLAKRAINTFKFPRISTDYTTIYAIRVDDSSIEEVDETDKRFKNAIPHAYFNHQLGDAEIEIIIA